MRVALLSTAGTIHTIRWANGLVEAGVDVHVVSQHELNGKLDPRVTLHMLPLKNTLGYFFNVFAFRTLLKKIKPDLLNAHYATGYGVLAKLSGFKPYLLSVWGSDIYDFPVKSLLHRLFLKRNLSAASAVASTSLCMAKEMAKTYKHKQVFITPFGVDELEFNPQNKPVELQNKIVIGTVKTLKSKYGIDTLIDAFSIVWNKKKCPKNLMLEITGSGPDLNSLKVQVDKLGLTDNVVFQGFVDHTKVPDMLNRLDVYLALSRLDSESFGVAILEASACGLPVIVSDTDGPAEVVKDTETGFIVPRENPEAAAKKILELIDDVELRQKMGKEGVRHVREHYTWSKSVEIMLEAYQKTINS